MNGTTEGVTYRVISGYPDYRVGDDGSVWRVRTVDSIEQWRRMKTSPNDRGYLRVNLYPSGGGKYRTFRVHKLVLEAFVGPCPEGLESRHRNGIRTDNNLTNLKYGTYEENQEDIELHGTRPKGETHPLSILTEADVLAIRARYAAGELQKVLADDFSTSVSNISVIVNRKNWRHI